MSAYSTFLMILDAVRPTARLTIDDVRAPIEAAQFTDHEKGQVWKDACRDGYLIATRTIQPSTHPPAKRRPVQVYERTDKPVRKAS